MLVLLEVGEEMGEGRDVDEVPLDKGFEKETQAHETIGVKSGGEEWLRWHMKRE